MEISDLRTQVQEKASSLRLEMQKLLLVPVLWSWPVLIQAGEPAPHLVAPLVIVKH